MNYYNNGDSFDLLPREVILQVCESVDDATLQNLMVTNSRVAEICQQVYQRRMNPVRVLAANGHRGNLSPRSRPMSPRYNSLIRRHRNF